MDSEKRKKIKQNTLDILILTRKAYEQDEIYKSDYERIIKCSEDILGILNKESGLEKLENNN